MSRAARSCPRSESDVLADLGLASFKPAQQAAHRMLVGAISGHRALARPWHDNTSCIVVLPTSSGKDLLSFSVARAFSGTTICFHPLKSLTEAAIAYGRRFNCTVTVLTAAGGIDRVGCSDVVVAAYEQAGDLMIGLYQTLAQKGRLCMTVFNEAHTAVRLHTCYYLPLPPHSSSPIPLSLLLLKNCPFLHTEQLHHVDGNWRNFGDLCMLVPKIRRLCGPQVFVVCSATVQQQHMGPLASTLCLPAWSHSLVQSPVRNNLIFSLVVADSTRNMVQQTIDRALAAPLRTIIFVPTLLWLSTLLDVFAESERLVFGFHADLSPDSKTQSLSGFASHEASILVTTTALSCGMNVPDVSDVIVFSEVSCTENLLQFGGRAARQGNSQDGRCVFITCRESVATLSYRARISHGAQQVLRLIQSPDFAAALYDCYTPHV